MSEPFAQPEQGQADQRSPSGPGGIGKESRPANLQQSAALGCAAAAAQASVPRRSEMAVALRVHGSRWYATALDVGAGEGQVLGLPLLLPPSAAASTSQHQQRETEAPLQSPG